MAHLNVEVEFGKELVDFEQDDAGVTARVLVHDLEGDAMETVKCDYIVSAEGGKSERCLSSINTWSVVAEVSPR